VDYRREHIKDFRDLMPEDETALGIVKIISSVSEDHIIFFDEHEDIKYLSERRDEVFQKAAENVQQLSAKAFKKLNRVNIRLVNQHLASCFAQALKPDMNLKDVKRIFKSAKNYIKSTKATKIVLGSGPIPWHIVFIDENNRVGAQYKEPPDHTIEAMSKLSKLRQLNFSLLPKYLRLGVATSIGNSMVSVLRSSPTDDLKSYVDDAENHLFQNVDDWHYSLYALTSFTILIIIGLTIYLKLENYSQMIIGLLGGSV